MTADANPILVSPPKKARRGAVDGQEAGRGLTDSLGPAFLVIFFPKADWPADSCPLATSSRAPSVGAGSLVGAGLGEFLVEGAGGLSWRTPRAVSPLSLPTPTTLRPHGAGRNQQTAFPTPGPRTPAKAVPAQCATPLWLEISGRLAGLNGGWEGDDPPEAQESPGTLGGWACHRAWALGLEGGEE